MEAILACHSALCTKWLDWVANSVWTMTYSHMPHRRFRKRWRRPQILHFRGDDRRIRSMHVLIRPRLLPYTSIVPAKLQDLRPSPSFTKSSITVQLRAHPAVLPTTTPDRFVKLLFCPAFSWRGLEHTRKENCRQQLGYKREFHRWNMSCFSAQNLT